MKPCGGCSLCCKLIDVPGLAPAGEWCSHCNPGKADGGCSIHDNRPSVCLGFNCFWRAESWPDEFRPDRCKVIFEALPGVKTILVSVEPSRPDAWKKKNIRGVIEKLRRKGRPVVLKTKNDSEMFIPPDWTRDDVIREMAEVIKYKEKTYGSTHLHN